MPRETIEVRRQVLAQRAEDAVVCLEAAGRWVTMLDGHRKNGRWRPEPAVVQRYENAQRALRAARFRLGQAESEGDLDAAESARAEACAGRDEVAGIGRGAGFDPPS